jgi:hypothetical protein
MERTRGLVGTVDSGLRIKTKRCGGVVDGGKQIS